MTFQIAAANKGQAVDSSSTQFVARLISISFKLVEFFFYAGRGKSVNYVSTCVDCVNRGRRNRS